MMRRSNAAASWSMAAAMLCLLAGASLRAGQSAPEASLVSEQYFKNIQVLKGMPVDTFFDAMGMFAASMGNDCTFCHAKEAGFRREAFAETTPRIQRARQMIRMMQALNEQKFGGRPRVTCFTCHRGQYSPVSAPSFLIQYGVPVEDPDIIDFPTEAGVSADQVFDRYLTAIRRHGGARQNHELHGDGHVRLDSTPARRTCRCKSSRRHRISARGSSSCRRATATASSTA
jgi:hypothetical protein